MIRRIFGNAIRGTIEDVLRDPLSELKAGQSRLEVRFDETNKQIAAVGARLDSRIDALGARLDTKIDALGQRLDGRIGELGTRLDGRIDGLDKKIDALGQRLDGRIGELTAQQNRIVEEVAALKRDQKSADVVERRLTRIEDRLFAKAG